VCAKGKFQTCEWEKSPPPSHKHALNVILHAYLSDLNEYWGRGDAKNYKEDKTIKPFKISYSAEVSTRISYFSHLSLASLSCLNERQQKCKLNKREEDETKGRRKYFMNIYY
jgi:hypothetical protein